MVYTAVFYNEDDNVLLFALAHNIVPTRGLTTMMRFKENDLLQAAETHPHVAEFLKLNANIVPIVAPGKVDVSDVDLDDIDYGKRVLRRLIRDVHKNKTHSAVFENLMDNGGKLSAVILYAESNYGFLASKHIAPFLHQTEKLLPLFASIPVVNANIMRYLVTATPQALVLSQAAMALDKHHLYDTVIEKDEHNRYMGTFHGVYCRLALDALAARKIAEEELVQFQVHKEFTSLGAHLPSESTASAGLSDITREQQNLFETPPQCNGRLKPTSLPIEIPNDTTCASVCCTMFSCWKNLVWTRARNSRADVAIEAPIGTVLYTTDQHQQVVDADPQVSYHGSKPGFFDTETKYQLLDLNDTLRCSTAIIR